MDDAHLGRHGQGAEGGREVPAPSHCVSPQSPWPLQGTVWTPSSMIRRFGKEIDDESSIYYWAYKVVDFVSLLACLWLTLARVAERYSSVLPSHHGRLYR